MQLRWTREAIQFDARTNDQNDAMDQNDGLPTMRACRAEGPTDTSLGRKAQVPPEKMGKGCRPALFGGGSGLQPSETLNGLS